MKPNLAKIMVENSGKKTKFGKILLWMIAKKTKFG
jgi:hypothetical protein